MATLARKVQAMIGHPTDPKFKDMVSNKVISNCPIKVIGITNAARIFGPNRAGLRGKTVRRKPDRVDTDVISIPRDFYVLHTFVTLTADVMFINGVAFLVTLSPKIKMYTIEHIPTRTAKQLGSSLMKVVQLYARGGFTVNVALMDMEFEKVANELEMVQVTTTAARVEGTSSVYCIRPTLHPPPKSNDCAFDAVCDDVDQRSTRREWHIHQVLSTRDCHSSGN